MATHLNLQVIGRLGNDLKNENSKGVDFVNMSLAHSIPVLDKEKNEWTERTVWIRATFFGKIEKLDYYKKGALLLVEGMPSADLVQPRDGGAPYASLTMTTYRIPKILLHAKEPQPYATPANPPQQRREQDAPVGAQPIAPSNPQPTFQNDLPF